jgi:hypothetical protein
MSTKRPKNFEQADARLTVLAHGLPNDADGFRLLMGRIVCEPDPAALLGVLTVIGVATKIDYANRPQAQAVGAGE